MNSIKIGYITFLCFVLVSFVAPTHLCAQNDDLLLKKVMRNDISAVKELLASGANINQQNKMYGHTSLIIACNYNYEELAIILISKGADVNIKGKDGATALIAASSNSQKIVKLLLSKGADIKAKMKNGTGAFTQCTNGILMERVSFELAEILLSKGANVDESPTVGSSEGYTSLIRAARNNHEGLVKFLIKNGANVNTKTKKGLTALSLAEKKGHQEIIKILKSNGAK